MMRPADVPGQRHQRRTEPRKPQFSHTLHHFATPLRVPLGEHPFFRFKTTGLKPQFPRKGELPDVVRESRDTNLFGFAAGQSGQLSQPLRPFGDTLQMIPKPVESVFRKKGQALHPTAFKG